jgi:hypothetical protein
MVRQEYIKELQLRAHEILQEVRGNDNKHIDEFEGILKILWSYILEVSTDKPNQGEQLKRITTSGNAKGKKPWELYIMDVLKEIGGKAKSKDVSALIITRNPNLIKSKVMQTVRHQLSLLSKSGEIGVIRNEIQSEGHEYYIK